MVAKSVDVEGRRDRVGTAKGMWRWVKVMVDDDGADDSDGKDVVE